MNVETLAELGSWDVHNIVATVWMRCRIDLSRFVTTIFSRGFGAAWYDAKRFGAAAKVCLREPKSTALIFHSGSMVVTGAETRAKSLLAARIYWWMVRMCGFDAYFDRYKVQNVVGAFRFPETMQIDLAEFAAAHPYDAMWEPDLFPGCIFRPSKDRRYVLIIFVSARGVITGGHTRDDIGAGYRHLSQLIAPYVRSNVDDMLDTLRRPDADLEHALEKCVYTAQLPPGGGGGGGGPSYGPLGSTAATARSNSLSPSSPPSGSP